MPMYNHAPEPFGNRASSFLTSFLHMHPTKILTALSLLFAVVSSHAAAPSVFIRSPTNNAAFIASPNLTLIAQASDPDAGGSVTRVEFYRGGSTLIDNRPMAFSVWFGRTCL